MTTDPSFPDRLARLMREKNMTRAELARHVWGTFTDERGYEVAKNRQSISKYLSGRMSPSEKTKQLLASALGVRYEDIDPNSDPTNRPGSGITLTQINNRDSRLDLSMILPTEIAGQVVAIVGRYAT